MKDSRTKTHKRKCLLFIDCNRTEHAMFQRKDKICA